MNTKKLLTIGLIVSLVLIGVFFVLKISINSTLKEREGRVDYISTRQETQSREEIIKRFDLYNKAIETLNDDMCKSIVGDADMKIRCSEEIYTTRAVKEMNVHLCEKINNPNILNSCKNNFFYKNALLSKAQDSCNSIIGDSGLMNICREAVLGGPKDDDGGNNLDMEILSSSMKTNDLKACTSISTKELQIKCSDGIYFRQAISSKDSLICEKISNAFEEGQCIDNVHFMIEQEKK